MGKREKDAVYYAYVDLYVKQDLFLISMKSFFDCELVAEEK